MIGSLICALVLAQTPQPQQTANGAALISKMFAYYASANSLTGTIHCVQQAQNIAISLDTTVAYVAPSKLYLRQVLTGAEPRTWLVTSDGKSFTYDYPNERRFSTSKPEPGRLLEAVSPSPSIHQNFRQIFEASMFSLGDISVPVLLSIGGNDELQAIKDQIATIGLQGTDKIGGQTVNVLVGDWKAGPRDKPSAQYKLYITDDGQLKRYVQRAIVSMSLPGAQLKPQEVISTWDVNLQVNAKPDDSLFKVVTSGD